MLLKCITFFQVKQIIEEIALVTPENMDETVTEKILKITKVLTKFPMTNLKKLITLYVTATGTDDVTLRRK